MSGIVGQGGKKEGASKQKKWKGGHNYPGSRGKKEHGINFILKKWHKMLKILEKHFT